MSSMYSGITYHNLYILPTYEIWHVSVYLDKISNLNVYFYNRMTTTQVKKLQVDESKFQYNNIIGFGENK